MSAEQVVLATQLLDGPAEGNGEVVQRLLAEKEIEVPLRTPQRALAPHREGRRATTLATVRFETRVSSLPSAHEG